uniref:SHSP domain-containing protein n=1 Tax=Cannabis sativa TaxID=3483 RepID=A0A803PIV0_CANSA
MANPIMKLPIALLILLIITVQSTTALVPYTGGSLWDVMLNNIPSDDPFRILEHTPFPVPTKASEPLALARADWKETASEHGDKWHRSERISGKFWRRFRLPENADLDAIKAKLENGVLKITVPKLAEEKKKQPKVIDISEHKAEL